MSAFTKIFQKWLPGSHHERTPFATLHGTRRWIDQLQFHHEYEAHQMVVEALHQFNLSSIVLDERRLHVLALLRHAGCKLQEDMVAQYLKNQTTFRYAGKSLWQEIFAFYWQLALAYQSFVKAAAHGHPTLDRQLPAITLLALHYQGKLIQWRYMRYETPTQDAWRNVHALYAIAEYNGFAGLRLNINNIETSCTHTYAHILLLNLINPIGLAPWKIELVTHWIHTWCRHLQPVLQLDIQTHTHWLDLAGCNPLLQIEEQPVEGAEPRYWSLHSTAAALEITRAQLINPPSSKLDGIKNEADVPGLLDDIQAILSRGGSLRLTPRRAQYSSVLLVCGFEHALRTLGLAANAHPMRSEPWSMQDEGENGYGLTHYGNPDIIPEPGTLISVRTGEKKHPWALAAIRWLDIQSSQPVQLGAERLGSAPRLVVLHGVEHPMSESIFSMINPPTDCASSPCIFLPEQDERRISSALVVGDMSISIAQIYDMLDGKYIYRIRITQERTRGQDWLLLKFDILTRRHIEHAEMNSFEHSA